MREFVLGGELGLDHALAGLGAGQQIRQAMIALRPEDQIDGLGTARDLLALGLGDAAGDADLEVPARSRARSSASRPSSEKTFSVAFSRMWQVLSTTRSASSITGVGS